MKQTTQAPRVFLALIVLLLSFANSPAQTVPAQTVTPKIEITQKDGVTIVRMEPLKISGAKDEYHSLHFAISFKYSGEKLPTPEHVDFEIQTIAKRHTLNSDLYVVFLIDGETLHLSSSRWAVKNPFPDGR